MLRFIKKSDAAKTETYTNGDFSEGNFDGWVFMYFTFSENKGTNNLSSATFSAEGSDLDPNGETYLEMMPFEEAPLKHIDYALHFTATDKGPIMQRYKSFEIGENYTFTFSLSNTVDQSNLIVGAFDKDGRTSLIQEATPISAEDMGYYTVYTYQFPSVATSSNTYGKETFVDVAISGNTYYQKAGSIHPVIKGNKTFGDDLASFEAEIKTIDTAPKKIAWVN